MAVILVFLATCLLLTVLGVLMAVAGVRLRQGEPTSHSRHELVEKASVLDHRFFVRLRESVPSERSRTHHS